MTSDEVIRLAKEAGIPDDNIPSLAWGRLETGAQLLERFAALVAAAEREACAADCDAAADRLAACPAYPENRAAISALRHRAAAIRTRGES